jgi:hypothetical protein
MAGIPSTVESLLAVALIGKGLLLSRRKSRMDEALALLVILLCGAGVFLSILALTRFLETLYRPDMAAALAGVSVFILAALVAFIRRIKDTHGQHTLKHAGSDIEKSLRGVVETIQEEVNEPIRDNPKMAILIAAIAGFAATYGRR